MRDVDPAADAALAAEHVVKLAVLHNLAELEVEHSGLRIRVVRTHGPGAASRSEAMAGSPSTSASEAATLPSHLHTIEAPMVGTFYRAAAPDAPPFVGEGDAVEQGQVLCLIEAMKLMNEIECKVAGRIAKILVENAQPVEYGQPLFLIEPR
jgi:acetyl-CoA carboxylase biotin carboxyl carrier protein